VIWRGDNVFETWLSQTGTSKWTVDTGAWAGLQCPDAAADIELVDSGGAVTDRTRVSGCVELGLNADDKPIYAPMRHEIALGAAATGGHSLRVEDYGAGFRLDWPAATQPVVSYLGDAANGGAQPAGAWWGFVYVPAGTSVVGGWSAANVRFSAVYPESVTSSGALRWALKTIDTQDYSDALCDTPYVDSETDFSIPVPESVPGHGQIWRFYTRGSLALETVPPYVARHPEGFLLPASVVEADGLSRD
jgi:hypothetical protein